MSRIRNPGQKMTKTVCLKSYVFITSWGYDFIGFHGYSSDLTYFYVPGREFQAPWPLSLCEDLVQNLDSARSTSEVR